jgi:hypothetical protein
MPRALGFTEDLVTLTGTFDMRVRITH